MEYSAGMISKLFWLSESRKTAECMLNGWSKDEIRRIAIEENIYQVKAEYRMKEVLNGTYARLSNLPKELLNILVNSDIATAKLLILISIMKTDKFFFEFMYEVYRITIILGESELTDSSVEKFFDQKKSQSEIVSGWTEASKRKIIQCLKKNLFEAGLIKSTREKIITPVAINYRLREILEENNMEIYIQAITGEN